MESLGIVGSAYTAASGVQVYTAIEGSHQGGGPLIVAEIVGGLYDCTRPVVTGMLWNGLSWLGHVPEALGLPTA